MPTIKDVAELAGVSTATVSHFINKTKNLSPDTRVRVERAIEKLDYIPSTAGRALALQKFGKPEDLEFDTFSKRFEKEANKPQTNNTNGYKSSYVNLSSDAANPSRTTRKLLRLIRAVQPVSRIELANRLKVNKSTISTIVNPLIDAGIIFEEQTSLPNEPRLTGRPRVSLTFNSNDTYFIGVNMGIRGIQIGAATLGGEILGDEEFVTPSDPQVALANVHASIERLRRKAVGRRLKVIGVSVPGPTNAERTSLLYAPHLGWRDVSIADALKFSSTEGKDDLVPVIIENDATAAALYEARLNLAKSADDALNSFILVRSGTGIGVGLVIGGEVYRGTEKGEGLAGEFGHTTIVAGGKPCVCGNRGCWERYASASAAASLYMGDRPRLGFTPPRFVEIVARAEGGELRAKRTLEHMGEYLGIGIGNVITGVGVSHVILSGRIVYGWKYIKEPLLKAVGQSMAGKLSDWLVEPGEPTGAGLGGALEVAVEGFFTTIPENN